MTRRDSHIWSSAPGQLRSTLSTPDPSQIRVRFSVDSGHAGERLEHRQFSATLRHGSSVARPDETPETGHLSHSG
jgi:hypothetical protein